MGKLLVQSSVYICRAGASSGTLFSKAFVIPGQVEDLNPESIGVIHIFNVALQEKTLMDPGFMLSHAPG